MASCLRWDKSVDKNVSVRCYLETESKNLVKYVQRDIERENVGVCMRENCVGVNICFCLLHKVSVRKKRVQ